MTQDFPKEQVDAIIEKALAFENSWYRSVTWDWIYGELQIQKGKKIRKAIKYVYEQKLVPELSSRWPNSKEESIRGME